MGRMLTDYDGSLSVIITLPSSVSWLDYQKELRAAAEGAALNFKVRSLPKHISAGDRCYLVHRGFIRGWMTVTGLSEKSFVCGTTGRPWSGRFIERSGEFHALPAPVPYRGFQGFRYFNFDDCIADLVEKTGCPDGWSFVSSDTHREIERGVYPGEISGTTITAAGVRWTAEGSAAVGPMAVNVTVDSDGRAYIKI